MKNLSVLNYLATAALVSVIMLLIYASVQQTYRTGLNDPQVQMSRDISSKLEQGRSIESFIAADTLDITKSLSPFIILYDEQGKPFRSNALLDGKMPQLPLGIFEVVKNSGEHRVTWQPRQGVRMAMVIVRTNASPVQFVAAGRSMIEGEARTKQMMTMVFFTWLGCLAIIIITALLNYFMRSKKILQKAN